jgi:hypothetical protein
MSDFPQTSESVSLWDCLHDGNIDGVFSDLLAQTVAFVIDVPFHWEFNSLVESTRFRISFAEVLATTALTFLPWPGRHTNLTAADYELSQDEARKGRLQSVEWDTAFRHIESTGELLIYDASFIKTQSSSSFHLEGSTDSGDYYELRIEAKQARFFIGDSEVSLDDFLKFGERYWKAFVNGTIPEDLQKELE